MKKLYLCVFGILVSLCFLYVLTCNKQDDTLKIGLINPDTGELATYGEKIRRGIEIAEEEIVANNLLNGRKLVVIKEDTKGDSKESLTAVQKLINIDKVKYIIGEISGNATIAVLPYTESKGAFLFSPGAASPKLTNASELFARNWPSNSAEAISAAEYSYDVLGYQSAIIIYVNNEWGLGLQDNFENKFKSKGGKIESKEIYPYENTEFRSIVSKVKNIKADVIYLAGNQREMGLFMKQLREAKVSTPVVSNTSFLESDCLKLAGNAANGVIVPTPAYDPESQTSIKIKSFSERYEKKYGTMPSLVDANGYDALMLIVEAINKVGDNPIEVAKYIRNLKNYEAAGGIESFENGDVIIENNFKIIKDGEVQSVE
jgi:branched-chain amino acid transport system substrate-binding protein